MTVFFGVWMLLVGCGGEAPPEVPEDPPEAPPPPPPEPEVKLPSPDKLYAMCQDRVEKPQADGECTTDEDCVRAGCSSEVCTTAASAAELTTTCEDKLCFKALDTCGCVEGVCSWSLVDELPDNAIPATDPEGNKPQGSLPTQEEAEEDDGDDKKKRRKKSPRDGG